MLIVCPTCATSYMVDQAALGAAGRTVRCARCKAAWFAGGPEPAHDPAAAEPVAAEAAPPSPRTARSKVAASAEAAPAPVEEEPTEPDQDLPAVALAHAEKSAKGPSDSAQIEQETGKARAADTELVTVTDAPPIAPDDHDTAHAGTTAGSETEGFDTRRRLLQARRKKSRRSSRWTAVILLLVAVNVAVIGGRNEVVRYFPQTASLFAAIGVPVNLRNLRFENVKLTTEDANGVAMLNVSGTIVSELGKPVGVPKLRFAMRNAAGHDVYTWTMAPPRSILEPGDRIPFHSQIPVPKVDAADVMVRFLTPQDTGAK